MPTSKGWRPRWVAGLVLAVGCTAGCGGSGGGGAKGPAPAAPPPAKAVVTAPRVRPPAADAMGPELQAIFSEIAADRIPSARAKLEEYLSRMPDDGGATFLMGLTYHREKRYAQALPYFERAVDLVPEYKPVHHFLGWCRYWLGDMKGARAAFERHLELETSGSGRGDSIFGIGLVDLEEDRPKEAEARFMESIAIQGNDPKRVREVSKAHARIADICIQQGRLEEARARLETATGLWPEHYAAFYKLYQVRLRLGQETQAQAAYHLYRYWQDRVEARGVPGQIGGMASEAGERQRVGREPDQ